MANKRTTLGDIEQLLESEGFSKHLIDSRLVFEEAKSGAIVRLRLDRGGAEANRLEVQLIRRTMVDFGFMSEEEFAKWAANPKHFQAA